MSGGQRLADALEHARALAETDALVFHRRGWELPSDWPLDAEHVRAWLAHGDLVERRRSLAAMRRAGQARWDELRTSGALLELARATEHAWNVRIARA